VRMRGSLLRRLLAHVLKRGETKGGNSSPEVLSREHPQGGKHSAEKLLLEMKFGKR
jgi:hypothetical protein